MGPTHARGQIQGFQESIRVHKGDGSRGGGADCERGECFDGGILGDQIKQARRLIASHEKAIAFHAAALKEVQETLAELERLAIEAESVEEEE